MGNSGGCPPHRKALGVTAAAVYAAKKAVTETAVGRLQCYRLVGVTLYCLPFLKSRPAVMQLFAKILDHFLLFTVAVVAVWHFLCH